MEHEKRSDDQEHLEAHSLPGTNQAGKGPGQDAAKDEKAEESKGDQNPREQHEPDKTVTPS